MRGAEIVLLVNGQELARARDEAFSEGWLGFGVGFLSEGPAEGRFANLVVTSVDKQACPSRALVGAAADFAQHLFDELTAEGGGERGVGDRLGD